MSKISITHFSEYFVLIQIGLPPAMNRSIVFHFLLNKLLSLIIIILRIILHNFYENSYTVSFCIIFALKAQSPGDHLKYGERPSTKLSSYHHGKTAGIFEICNNGIDDDGDNLVDMEDYACYFGNVDPDN